MSAFIDEDYGFTPAQDYQTDKIGYDEYGFTSAIPDKISYQQPEEEEQEQSTPEYVSRTAGAAATGYASGTPYGLITNFMNILSMGDIYDPETIEQVRKASEREGIPFDEEAYMESAQKALGSFPTPANIAKMAEEALDLPLTPKDKFQKGIELAFTAGKFQQGTAAQKGITGGVAAGTSHGLEEIGVPEPLAELAGLATGNLAGTKTPKIDIGKVKKPSGLTERRFESIIEPREISASRKGKIESKLENDFKEISEKITSEAPISKTKELMTENPAYKQEVTEQFRRVEELAKELPEKVNTNEIKKKLVDNAKKNREKGFVESEYEADYKDQLNNIVKKTKSGEITSSELVDQFRKNNESLGEAFEPGRSKAFNRGKKDALLDHNRAIAEIIDEKYPDSEFSNLFKETNKKWTEIRDVEYITESVDKLFEGGINFKEGKKILDNKNSQRILGRALGNDGKKHFNQLMSDMLESESPFKMLKVAKEKGFTDLVNSASAYIIHPKLGMAKTGFSLAKKGFRAAVDAMLDQPKLAFTWEKGVKALKKGDFKAAEAEFKALDAEVLVAEKQVKVEPLKKPETINVTGEKISEPKKEMIVKKTESKIQEKPKEIQHKPKEDTEKLRVKREDIQKDLDKDWVKFEEKGGDIITTSIKDLPENIQKKMKELQEIDNVLLNSEIESIKEVLPKNLDENQVRKVIKSLGVSEYATSIDEISNLENRLNSFSDVKQMISDISFTLLPESERMAIDTLDEIAKYHPTKVKEATEIVNDLKKHFSKSKSK